MPTLFVGLHLALALFVGLFGLWLLLDPCGGSGGDVCLGGVAGLSTLGVVAVLLVGLAIWRFGRRASPLLVLDSLFAAVALYVVSRGADIRVPFILVGGQLVLAVALIGAIASGRAVVTHRIETVLTIAVLVGVAVFVRFMGIEAVAIGLVALAAGWLVRRRAPVPAGEEVQSSPWRVHSGPHGEDREE